MATIVNYCDVHLQSEPYRLIYDNILTVAEKPGWLMEYNTILGEQASIDTAATKYGFTALKTTYDNAITTLTNYLNALPTTPVAWNDLTNTTTLSNTSGSGATFRTNFENVQIAKNNINTAIANIPLAATAQMLVLSATSQVFQISKTNVGSPTSITFTANRTNLAPSPTWSVISGTATLTSVAADSATLLLSNMSTDSVEIKCTDSTGVYYDTMTIIKVYDGLDTVSGYLTNDSVTLPADSGDNVLTYGAATGTFKVYHGSVDVTTSCSFSVTSNTAGLTPTNSINASTGVYAITGGFAPGTNTANITYQASYTDAFGTNYTLSKTFTLGKSIAGATGANGTNGTNGTRGTVNLAISGYTSWSDAAANSAISSAGYGSPITGDVVTEYSSTFSSTHFYTVGVGWQAATAYINGNMLVSGTISAGAIQAGTFTGFTFQTSASGSRVIISSANNDIEYYTGSNLAAQIGTTTANGSPINGFGQDALDPAGFFTTAYSIAAIYGNNSYTGSNNVLACGIQGVSSLGAGVYGVTAGSGAFGGYFTNNGTSGTGYGLYGRSKSTSGYGAVVENTTSGVALYAVSAGGTAISAAGLVIPTTTNSYTCGSASFAWSGIYSQTALTVTSDIRYKLDIKKSDLGLDFINKLGPSTFRVLNGDVHDSIPNEGTRIHYGFIAQEVKEAIGDIDSGIWCLEDKNNPESKQMLRYEELLAPIVKAIQELDLKYKSEIEELKNQISKLGG